LVFSLNGAVRDIRSLNNHPFRLDEFLLGEGGLEQSRALVEAIEAMRLGKPNAPSALVDVLNASTREVPRFKVEGREVRLVRLGSLALQVGNVLQLKGKDKFKWNALKRCVECDSYFYGGGMRKKFCSTECERRSNNRYKQNRDKIRSAYYRYNIRRTKRGDRKVSLRVFKDQLYKPR